ncbi:MAG TPA: carbamoyltransferase HypF [Bacteroidota bacterium]|nr:carbamoyltransferase HypF [Bacteroidota bacterium]
MSARVHIAIRGAVQGVGFRPFVYRLAEELRLTGWVLNSPQGVFTEAEGERPSLEAFILRIEREKPPRASIQSLEYSFLDPKGYHSFEIRTSTETGETTALVLPDIATCDECRAEIFDPSNRRYLYPFTNCTNCGPRYTIIESLPYDRTNTSMRHFAMCEECRREYLDPLNRRFHAEPIACPRCGPQLLLWDEAGVARATGGNALQEAARRIRDGAIIALKGIGGFQLLVDARNRDAVLRLRLRKHREGKPFALMVPDLPAADRLCVISGLERRALSSSEAPIVLLTKRSGQEALVDPSVAPDNPYLALMLPYSPLHHLLLRELDIPVVATSGNLSDEPICIDEHEALERLHGIAEGFLLHDRPIIRHADDSIVRIMLGRELVLRRARGFAPLPVTLSSAGESLLAVGAHLKNTVAVAKAGNVFISQHIGDLETQQSLEAFHRALADLESLFAVSPQWVVSDLHPDYLSTQYARASGLPLLAFQHHHAHIASCMAENGLSGQALGISWDGTGYGLDGSVWGGEFFLVGPSGAQRVCALRKFRLPGGDKAVREPRRSAVGMLYELFGQTVFQRSELHPVEAFSAGEIRTLRGMLARGVNAPETSSIGRLFDAVASLIGLRQKSTYEGEAAMALEFALEDPESEPPYELSVLEDHTGAGPGFRIDWMPMVHSLIKDVGAGVPLPRMSARFHNALAEAAVNVARKFSEKRVVLSGGCFQNRYLTERIVRRLEEEHFQPYWHQRVPPNDGGISLGQIALARDRLAQSGGTGKNA